MGTTHSGVGSQDPTSLWEIQHTDVLSRNPTVGQVLQVSTEPTQCETAEVGGELRARQREDPDLSPCLTILSKEYPQKMREDEGQARKPVAERAQFTVVDNIQYYETSADSNMLLVVVPKSLRYTLLKEAHIQKFAGHFTQRRCMPH